MQYMTTCARLSSQSGPSATLPRLWSDVCRFQVMRSLNGVVLVFYECWLRK